MLRDEALSLRDTAARALKDREKQCKNLQTAKEESESEVNRLTRQVEEFESSSRGRPHSPVSHVTDYLHVSETMHNVSEKVSQVKKGMAGIAGMAGIVGITRKHKEETEVVPE